MKGPYFFRLSDNRIRLLHGPLELVMASEGPEEISEAAFARGWKRFQSIYAEIGRERDLLSAPLGEQPPEFEGRLAERMLAATWPFRALKLAPATAAAGVIAEEILEAMLPAIPLRTASVDMRGRIALWLHQEEKLVIETAGLHGWAEPAAMIVVAEEDDARGVSTSKGPDTMPCTVTALAHRAAEADLAAALIARIASSGETREDALARAQAEAELLLDSGIILGAALLLHGETRVIGARSSLLPHAGFGQIFTDPEGD